MTDLTNIELSAGVRYNDTAHQSVAFGTNNTSDGLGVCLDFAAAWRWGIAANSTPVRNGR